MQNKRTELQEPYFASEPETYEEGHTGFPFGNDFNREIAEPGEVERFPNGAVAIRIDCDFWLVGALPLEEYRNVPIEEIVAKFWPDVTNPEFNPDHGDPYWNTLGEPVTDEEIEQAKEMFRE
tara:strand:+ start:448 stop:813 length:366 start_codon:yes stop_codon:yes gene_type:complete